MPEISPAAAIGATHAKSRVCPKSVLDEPVVQACVFYSGNFIFVLCGTVGSGFVATFSQFLNWLFNHRAICLCRCIRNIENIIIMNESINPSTPVNAQQQAQLELLHSILGSAPSLPWHTYSPATAQYLDQLEQDLGNDLDDDLEMTSQWSQVSALAAALWESPEASLLTTLTQKFGTRMPQPLLAQLALQVQDVADSGQALVYQLVTTTQAILTDFAADDLQVMARPMALAMRSGTDDTVDSVVQSLRSDAWEQLSAVEQARLSLAIARYALAQLEADD